LLKQVQIQDWQGIVMAETKYQMSSGQAVIHCWSEREEESVAMDHSAVEAAPGSRRISLHDGHREVLKPPETSET
jgi:hypothetical protein